MRIPRLLLSIMTLMSLVNTSQAQSNLSLNMPSISPAPLATVENNGLGCFEFAIQNVNPPGYDIGGTKIKITLEQMEPMEGAVSVTSSEGDSSRYNWTYFPDSNVISGDQILEIGSWYTEDITICFNVTQNSNCAEEFSIGFGAEGIVINGNDGNATDNFASSFTCTDPDFVSEVENVNLSASVNVYPNPASEKINIITDLAIDLIEIYDHSGKLVFRIPYNPNISIDEFESGIYYLRLVDNENKSPVIKRFLIIQ